MSVGESVICLKDRLEQFLLCGGSAQNGDDDVREYFRTSVTFFESADESTDQFATRSCVSLQQLQSQSESLASIDPSSFGIDDRLSARREELLARISLLQQESRQQEILQLLQDYIQTEYKLQLFILAKAMEQVNQCVDIVEIPRLILTAKKSMPKTILEGSRIKQIVARVVTATKQRLLHRFHELFEEMLTEDSLSATMSRPSGVGSTRWEAFLRQSRDWLLAYSLISILPSTLSQSSQIVLDSFQQAMDEALTPLWGRFYHHLKFTRDSQSQSQILWSFRYARSFLTMVLGMCDQITSAEEMGLLYDVEYRTAAREQSLEKSLKFVRAHLASVFAELTYNTSFLLQLVDECVELDLWLREQSLLSSSSQNGLCSAVFDAREAFHCFLLLEHSLVCDAVHQRLLGTSSSASGPGPSPGASSSTGTLDSAKSKSWSSSAFASAFAADVRSSQPAQSLQCYDILYHILSLFMQLRERYSLFPAAAQLVLSELVLEPLLCLLLGVSLFHIRSDRDLYNVAVGLHLQTLKDSASVSLFVQSISYLQQSLRTVTKQQTRIVADSKRFKRKWTIIQNWIPKIFITEQHAQQGFSYAQLLKTVFKVPERIRNALSGDDVSLGAKDTGRGTGKWEYRLEYTKRMGETDDIAESASIARGLAMTLADVLEKQLRESN